MRIRSTGGLPAHIAGSFDELTACQQSDDGEYFVFDRRAHAVFSVYKGADAARKIVQIGAETGRILRPTAFDLGGDGTFVVADAPGGRERVQVFLHTGASLGGFTLRGKSAPLVALEGLVLSGVASLDYTGKSILVSQPESGALITEYAMDGRPLRTFGDLRPTGHENDAALHQALNTGRVVANPQGGYYFVFLTGVPVFRKYDAGGRLVFERHIEGTQLDAHVRGLPSAWPRRKSEEGEYPVVAPTVRAAAADGDGRLWVSLAVPYTYVYGADGEKQRAVQFHAAGTISPTGMFFTRDGLLIVTPGCYAFPGR